MAHAHESSNKKTILFGPSQASTASFPTLRNATSTNATDQLMHSARQPGSAPSNCSAQDPSLRPQTSRQDLLLGVQAFVHCQHHHQTFQILRSCHVAPETLGSCNPFCKLWCFELSLCAGDSENSLWSDQPVAIPQHWAPNS